MKSKETSSSESTNLQDKKKCSILTVIQNGLMNIMLGNVGSTRQSISA